MESIRDESGKMVRHYPDPTSIHENLEQPAALFEKIFELSFEMTEEERLQGVAPTALRNGSGMASAFLYAVSRAFQSTNIGVIFESSLREPTTMSTTQPAAVPPAARAENVPLGASLITLAFLLVAVMSAFGKAAGVSTNTPGVASSTIVFFQNFISLLLFLPWALWHGVGSLKTKHLMLHGVRGTAGMLSQALMFIAVLKMPLMNTVLLSNAAPLFIPIVAFLWLREKIAASTAISLGIGFLGVVLIIHPSADLLEDPAALLATAAAVCSAIALVAVNQLSITEPTYRILFYYFLTASLLTAPLLPFDWQAPTLHQWLLLLGIGLCQAGSQFFIILAYCHAAPARIAPFNYSVVIFSGIIGWIVWHNRPDALALIGVLLVAGGGIFTTVKAKPNTHGHFGWIGHWNAEALFRKHRENT